MTGLFVLETMHYLIGYYSGGDSNAVLVMRETLEDLCLPNPLNLCVLCDSAMHWSKTQSFEQKKKPSLIFIIPFEL